MSSAPKPPRKTVEALKSCPLTAAKQFSCLRRQAIALLMVVAVGLSVALGGGFGEGLLGFSFPVKKVRATSLFGESRGDHFHSGIDFATPQAIYPIGAGEVLLHYDRSVNPSLPRFGIGNFTVVEHADGLRSYYYHLADGSINAQRFEDDQGQISPETPLGFMGNTGYSLGAHLHLVVEDPRNNRLLNPALLLPPMTDTTKPLLVGLLLKIKNKLYRLQKRSTLKYLGPAELYVIGWDLRNGAPKKSGINRHLATGVFRLVVLLNEKKLKEYQFEWLEKTPTQLTLASGEGFYESYGLDFNYRIGEFLAEPGRHQITVQLFDQQQNETSKTYQLTFK